MCTTVASFITSGIKNLTILMVFNAPLQLCFLDATLATWAPHFAQSSSVLFVSNICTKWRNIMMYFSYLCCIWPKYVYAEMLQAPHRYWTYLWALLAGIFLHDPTSMAALLDPSLFTFRKGVVRVETEGVCMGYTLLDRGLKKYVLRKRNL